MIGLEEHFFASYPKAVDIAQTEYEAAKADWDRAAALGKYRFAGIRLGRAVFTTKQNKGNSA